MNARRPLSEVSGAPVTETSKLNAHLKALSLYGASLTLKVSVTRLAHYTPSTGKVSSRTVSQETGEGGSAQLSAVTRILKITRPAIPPFVSGCVLLPGSIPAPGHMPRRRRMPGEFLQSTGRRLCLLRRLALSMATAYMKTCAPCFNSGPLFNHGFNHFTGSDARQVLRTNLFYPHGFYGQGD